MTVTTIVGPPEANGGVGQYTTDFAEAFDEDVRVRRFDVGLNPLLHLRLALAVAHDDSEAVHLQFVYSFLGPAGVFSFFFFPLLYILTRVRSKPLVVTFHEVWSEEDTDCLAKRLYAYLVHTLISACSNHVTFLSENAQEAFHRTTWAGQTSVVTHGVNRNATQGMNDARSRFGLDEEDIVVSQHGYVNPRKGVKTFLDVAEAFPEYEFLIAGGPRTEENEQYFEGIRDSAPRNITITGVLDEEGFHAAFNATDLAILPYEDINQSGIFNWCAAYEIPTIATDIPYFERIQREYGCPMTYRRGQTDDVATVVGRVLDDGDRRNALRECMSEYAEDNSISAVAERFRDSYYH